MVENEKAIFKAYILKLITFYPTWKIDINNSIVMKTWFDMFEDITGKAFAEAVDNHIKKEIYNPTVASILKYVKKEEVLKLPLRRVEERL